MIIARMVASPLGGLFPITILTPISLTIDDIIILYFHDRGGLIEVSESVIVTM